MYLPGRNKLDTRRELRMRFYDGNVGRGKKWEAVDVGGCWRTAEGEMGAWIKKDREHVADGLQGTITDLEGAALWTESAADCLDIREMECDEDPEPADVTVAEVEDSEDESKGEEEKEEKEGSDEEEED